MQAISPRAQIGLPPCRISRLTVTSAPTADFRRDARSRHSLGTRLKDRFRPIADTGSAPPQALWKVTLHGAISGTANEPAQGYGDEVEKMAEVKRKRL